MHKKTFGLILFRQGLGQIYIDPRVLRVREDYPWTESLITHSGGKVRIDRSKNYNFLYLLLFFIFENKNGKNLERIPFYFFLYVCVHNHLQRICAIFIATRLHIFLYFCFFFFPFFSIYMLLAYLEGANMIRAAESNEEPADVTTTVGGSNKLGLVKKEI